MVKPSDLVACLCMNALKHCNVEYSTTGIRLSARGHNGADLSFGSFCFRGIPVKGAVLTDTEIKSSHLATK